MRKVVLSVTILSSLLLTGARAQTPGNRVAGMPAPPSSTLPSPIDTRLNFMAQEIMECIAQRVEVKVKMQQEIATLQGEVEKLRKEVAEKKKEGE